MLPRSEIEDYVAEDDEESQMALTDDGGHICPAAIGCIQAKHALNLPVRTSAMSDAFRKQLRAAFQNSYDMVNVIEFSKVAIQWSKKLAFTDRLAFLASSDVCPFLAYDNSSMFPVIGR